MKTKFIIVSICCTVLFTACDKTTLLAPLKDGEVQIRVENTTADNFQNLVVAEKDFGGIHARSVTGYQSFEKVIAYAGASLVTAGDTVYAGMGYCGTPPLPYLESGRYKLQIFQDDLIYSHYNARYIKE